MDHLVHTVHSTHRLRDVSLRYLDLVRREEYVVDGCVVDPHVLLVQRRLDHVRWEVITFVLAEGALHVQVVAGTGVVLDRGNC